jgi:16S rRNA (cytidine1402-2'-O)-methyltransferase
MSGKLYIVATPIGNLGDITMRALAILNEVDLILCEDTRITRKLLNHFGIKTPTKSYHQHSGEMKKKEIKKWLEEGNDIALVTDAGTPGISDPGNELVSQLSDVEGQMSVVPVPGVSAIVTALSVSGFPTDKFLFLGFPPHKNKRKKFFEEVRDAQYTVAFYESSHRIKKALLELSSVLSEKREVCICRELTKKFETIYRGSIGEIKNANISEKGEFVVVIRK